MAKEKDKESERAWRLISVLFSSVPLTSALAGALLEAARLLWSSGQGSTRVGGDALSGRVTSMEREVVLGALSGPAFEAELETARGAAKVRFLVARDALGAERRTSKRPSRELLN